MKKQFLAKLLVLAMVLAMVPVTVLAANAASAGNNDGYYFVSVDTTVRENEPTDGTLDNANTTLGDTAVESLADQVVDGQIVLNITADATKISVSFPAKAMTALAEETGADLVIESSVATITIPNEVLCSELGTSGTVKISAQNTASSVSFSIQVSGRALNGVKGIQVTF